MPCPGVGPCGPFELDLGCCLTPSGSLPDPCLLQGEPVPQEVIDSAVLAASQLLWALTGRQFGCCTKKIRPCRQKCNSECCLPDGFGFPWTPVHLANGDWTNVSCDCKGGCSCVDLCQIELPYPVCSIDEVKVDGIVLGEGLYRVDDFKWLVRTSGVAPSGIDGGTIPYRQTLDGSFGPVGTVTSPSGEVVVTGAGAVAVPGTINTLGGIQLPNNGVNYTVNLFSGTNPGLGSQRCDVAFELDLDITGTTFDIAGVGGAFEVDSISGGGIIAKVGSTVTVGPVQVANTSSVVRIRATNSCLIQATIIPQTDPITITAVQWSSITQLVPCHGEEIEINGTPAVQTGNMPFAFEITGPSVLQITSDTLDFPGNIIEWPIHPTPYTAGQEIFSQVAPNGNRAKLTVTSVVGPTGPYFLTETDGTIDIGSTVGFTLEFLCAVPANSQCWPECNDLTKNDDQPGTWSVTVTYGRPVPELVLLAAAQFACELIKGCMGKDCKLPQRVSSISRQGVSVSFLDPMSFLSEGLTGLYLVDLAARTYNPNRLQRRPVVYSPDVANKWRVTDTGTGPSNC